jgi:hypothetical protein
MATAAGTAGPSQTQWDLIGTSSLNTGTSDPLTVFSAAQTAWSHTIAQYASGVEVLATPISDATRASAAIFNTGAALTTGTAAGRRVHFPLAPVGPAANLTQDGKDYLVKLTMWAAGIDPQTNASITATTVSGSVAIPAPTVTAVNPNAIFSVSTVNGSVTIGGTPSVILPYPGTIAGVEPETHVRMGVICDSNGNLYRITESDLASNNQPRMMKSSDQGQNWSEQDVTHRPGYPSTIGDLESACMIWDSGSKTLQFIWAAYAPFVVEFYTSDHPTTPDTWNTAARLKMSTVNEESTPQYASITNPTDQTYEWTFWGAPSVPRYRSRTSSTTVGTQNDLDTAGNFPSAVLAPNNVSYVIYKKSSQVHLKKLTSAGTLDGTSTRVDSTGVADAAGYDVPYGPPQAYQVGSDIIVSVLFADVNEKLRCVDILNGTPQTEQLVYNATVAANEGGTFSLQPIISLAVNPTDGTLFAIWADGATWDVMYSTRPYGGSWSTPATLVDVSTTAFTEIGWVTANKVTHGSNSYWGYTYDLAPHLDDASNIRYDRVAIVSGTPATVSASTVSGAVTVAGPTTTAGTQAVVTATTVSRTVAIAAPTVVAPATHVATSISRTVAIVGPTMIAGTGAAISATVVSGAVTIGAPTIVAGGSATASPAVVAGTVSIGAPTVVAPQSATIVATNISRTVAIAAPTVVSGTGATITATNVAGTVTVAAPTVNAPQSATVSPATISRAVVIGGGVAAAGGSATAAPSAVTGTTTIAAPTISASVKVFALAASVAVAVAVPTLIAGTGSTANPITISRAVAIAGPSVTTSSSATVSATTISRIVAIATPTVTGGSGVGPTATTISRVVTIGTPTMRADRAATVAAATISRTVSIPIPTFNVPTLNFTGWGIPIVTAAAPVETGAFYVSTSGVDTANGSIGSPWRTITYAATQLNPGNTLYIRGGVYQEKVRFDRNGTAEQPIKVKSYSGETAIIDGNYTLPATATNSDLLSVTADYIEISNIEVKNSLWAGITLYGVNNTLTNVVSHDNMEQGIIAWQSVNAVIQDCTSYNNCYSNENGIHKLGRTTYATGLSAGREADGTIIRRNVIYNNWGEGLSAYNALNTLMEDKIVYNNSKNVYISYTTDCVCQRNIIYATPGNDRRLASGVTQHGINLQDEDQNPSSARIKVLNNLVIGHVQNFKWFPRNGVDTDGNPVNNAANDVLIANNTFVNASNTTSQSAVQISAPAGTSVHSNFRFRNNIFIQEDSIVIGQIAAAAVTGTTWTNNHWSKNPPAAMLGTSSLVSDPQIAKVGSFTAGNLTGDYFKIASTSPSRNAGVTLAEVVDDYFKTLRPVGAAYDIGAHEYV